MRRLTLLFAVMTVALPCGADSPKEYDDSIVKTDPLQGTWHEIDYTVFNITPFQHPKSVIIFRNGTCNIDQDDGENRRWRYRFDPTSNPPHLDYIIDSSDEFKGKIVKHIYQVDGDTLRIVSFFWSTDGYPLSFNDADDGVCETYKRVK